MEIGNEEIATVLEEIALLLELQGANAFKTRAYRRGAEVAKGGEYDLPAMVKSGTLGELDGFGGALVEKITILVETGRLSYHEELRAVFPESLFELFELSGLGPKKIRVLYEALGVDSISKLKEVCESGEVAALSGFGQKTVEKLLSAIEMKEKYADFFRLGDIAVLAEVVLDKVRGHEDTLRCSLAGSYRRSKELLHDIDILAAARDSQRLMKDFCEFDEVEQVMACGETKASVRLLDGLQCDLRVVNPESYPFALQYFTGSKEHNVEMRRRAKKKGWSLNEYSMGASVDGEIKEEADIYRALGLRYIEPELREHRGEFEAAEAGRLPRLVELGDLKGTFHNHTTASDGRNTLAEMAEAARDLGLSYLGIADHSKSSFQANGLYPDRVMKQMAEIETLNRSFGGVFRIFAGSEVDILKDGSLDFEDSLLAKLDYVVASVHNAFTLSEEEMTKRIIRAIENEHVTMLGHMTGRLLLKRKPYALNVDKIIDCAAETGTVIELNCNPRRLDMDWRHWRKARDKGVKCSINPDAHRVEQLQFLSFGTRLARKGWLRKGDVVNTMSLAEMTQWLGLN